jgi:hypothetical protein
VLVAAAVLLVALGAGAAMALSGGRDDEEAAGDSPATTTATTASPTTDGGETGATTTSALDLGTLEGLGGLGGLGTGGSSGDGEPNDPLPGTDWNPEARTAFVADCADELATTGGGIVPDPSGTCGCVYDELEAGDVSFAELNEQWVLVDADPNSAAVQALNSASMSCMLAAAG